MRAALAFLLIFMPCPAFPEKADGDKPTQIEANRMSSDETRRLTIFEGSVLLTKGTMIVRADRIVIRQDAEGYQYATATGAPVRFRQRQDPARAPSSSTRRRASTAAATRSRATSSSSTSARTSSP